MTAANWCRIAIDGAPRLGRLDGDRIALYDGDLFADPVANGTVVDAADALWLPPVLPRQFLGLWNNFHERQQLEKTQIPDFPLFFVKLGESLSAHRQPIRRPAGFSGRVKFEAELGIVIGKPCYQPSRDAIDDFIFGYTCVNDVTAPEPLFANGEFHQWCRAKSFPGFGPIGPVIATGIDPSTLRVRGILDGEVKQDYPVSDMIFSPQEIVWHLAREIALYPGDVIACGTSVGAVDMADGQTIVIEIPGIGRLDNRLE
ncbi:MAG: fumarylacetoacetate hydrolase family protein [Gammaproteobacteria bacterium]|nr:fumarylacetoacetate hydrolase family protein [Gammaproteobacteria bacterium]MCP5316393.1 fumarylacetoacetate hydrolase family protein [Chromatiaceae bacterium]MCW5586144.1 fumarylacetoacetate hydrolase family protein [Chromatiales bacterium]MCB1818798.1 fumarylacetoacetate hydrolase family protein [Gammaproteobacteria bacterium]MCP5434299.1 fumarylacetoacetate hydrolase family protein [Chromatiaceae bacterium]